MSRVMRWVDYVALEVSDSAVIGFVSGLILGLVIMGAAWILGG